MSTAAKLLGRFRRNLNNPMTSDAGLLAASQYIAVGLNFAVTAIVARLLGPAEYGVAALVMAYPDLLWTFVGTKSISVTTRYITRFRASGQMDELRSICKLGYSLDLAASFAAFILVGLSGWWVARNVLKAPDLDWLMITFAASYPFFSFVGTNYAILTSWQKFRWLAGIQLIGRGFTSLLVLALVISGFGAPGVVIGMAVGQVITGLGGLAVATYFLRADGLGAWWKGQFSHIVLLKGELASFFGWNYLHVTFVGLVTQLPILLLGRIRGPEEAAFYRLATNITTVASYPEGSLRRVVYPIISTRWAKGERESLEASVRRWTLYGGLPLALLLAIGTLIVPLFIPLVFGNTFQPMIPAVQVMMIWVIVSIVFFWLNPFYYASGRIGHWARSFGGYTILVLALIWPVIHLWGFLGLVWLVGGGRVALVLFQVLRLRSMQGKPITESRKV